MTTYHDRKNKLQEQMAKAKEKIEKLTKRRAEEIGHLAMRYKLESIEDEELEKHFAKIAKNLNLKPICDEQNLQEA